VQRNHAAAVVAVFILAVSALALSAPHAWGQTVPAGSGAPAGPRLQAELLKTLDASHAKVGDEVTARTVTPLEFDGAKFPTGSTVIGHVKQVDPSRLVLVFDHIVVKKNAPAPVGLSLRAVVMPQSQQSIGEQMSPRAEAGGPGSAANPAVQTGQGRGDLLRSPEAAAQDSAVTVFQGPSSVETGNGGVVGLPGVQLGVSDDPKVGASFQAAKDQKLRLEKGLQVMFVVSK
jgi:hypothetical protein